MEDQLDPNIIKATQISLGKYVKRPPLTEKLLKKPPFRFLHDIVTSVLKSKGFFEGLFEENELNSDNVKDRDSKISFLNKIISVVSLTTGQSLSVKSSKIVSGQEPEKTNELLQCLAQALDKNISSHEAVRQYKAGVKIPLGSDKKSKDSLKSVKNTTDSKKLTSKSSEKLVPERNGKVKPKEANINKKESPPRKTVAKVSTKKKSDSEGLSRQHDSTKHNNIKSVNKTTLGNVEVEDAKSKKSSNNKDTIGLNLKSDSLDSREKETALQRDANLLQKDNLQDINLSQAVSSQQNVNLQNDANLQNDKNLRQDVNIQQNINLQEPGTPKSESISIEQVAIEVDDNIKKPTSAHREYTLKHEELKKETEVNTKDDSTKEIKFDPEENKAISIRNIEGANVIEPYKGERDENRRPVVSTDLNDVAHPTIIVPTIRPSSSRPAAPRVRDKNDITNDAENIIVGKVNIISEGTLDEEEEDTSIIVESQTTDILEESLESQKQNDFVSTQNSHLVHQILDSQKEYSQTSVKTEIEWQFGAQKTPDVFIQEMEQLRFSVQALSRIANPLGKLLDHIQEDVEVMRQELQQWTKLYEETSKDLLKQKNANAESLLPFHTKLKQLDTDIGEKHDKIMEVKVTIHKNAARIEKLLANGIVQ